MLLLPEYIDRATEFRNFAWLDLTRRGSFYVVQATSITQREGGRGDFVVFAYSGDCFTNASEPNFFLTYGTSALHLEVILTEERTSYLLPWKK